MTELVWHELGPAEDVPVGHLRRAELAETAVCIGRTDDGWVAFQDTCTHEECSLADGELEGRVVVCPCHGSEFDLRTGDVLCPPALDPLTIFEARVEDWEQHLEQMCAFWSSVALMSGRYHGTPMVKHLPLPVDAGHFDRWLELFEASAGELCPPRAAAELRAARWTSTPT